MSVKFIEQEVDLKASYTKEENERWLRYRELMKRDIITCYDNDYIMQFTLKEMDDVDWCILIEEVNKREQSWQTLGLSWDQNSGDKQETVEPRFIELVKAIGTHPKLSSFNFPMHSVARDNKVRVLLEVLKNGHSIQDLRTTAYEFDLETAHAFAKILMNNKKLLSLDISSTYCINYDERVYANESMNLESGIELAHALKTTSLQRLCIKKIDNRLLKVVLQSLPDTLLHLDLSDNNINENSIPIIRSYLETNGKTLKELILDDDLANQYLQSEASSSLSTVRVMLQSSWVARLFRSPKSIIVSMSEAEDIDWPLLITQITKSDASIRELYWLFEEGDSHYYSQYLITLLGQQCQLESLIIRCPFRDAQTKTKIFQLLEENRSIKKLSINSGESKVFDELIYVLRNNNVITEVHYESKPMVTDDDVIMLASCLKNNTILQSLKLPNSEIGDIGIQVLLNSIPRTLSKLEIENNVITAKSLPFLLAFLKAHRTLKYISLLVNGISSHNTVEVDVHDLMEKISEAANQNNCICYSDINESPTADVANAENGELYLWYLRDDHILELFHQLKKFPDRNWSIRFAYDNRITPIGYRCLRDILSSTIKVVEFEIYLNNMNEEAQVNLFSGLCASKTLQRCGLFGSKQLNNDAMDYIGRLIQNNMILTKLNLADSKIGDDGAVRLAKYLPESSLEELHLSYNSLGDRACTSLLSSIPSTLTEFLIHNNNITISSLPTILTFLAANRTLKKLTISWNPMFGDGYTDPCDNTVWQQIFEVSKQNNVCEVD